jgi:hypothetical protein
MALVELILDMRAARSVPSTPIEFLRWWDEAQRRASGMVLGESQCAVLIDPTHGEVRLRGINVPAAGLQLTATSEVAIHGILEPEIARPQCAICASQGRPRPATCASHVAQPSERRIPLCDEHVVYLDGSLRPYSPTAIPPCESGTGQATFVCAGPRCRWKRAWSEPFRRQHPFDPGVYFCQECYARLFPPCVGSGSVGCRAVGQYFCEHVDVGAGRIAQSACGNGVCPKHARMWQIFGPEHEGIILCPLHSNALRGDPVEAVRRMVLATAAKRARLERDGEEAEAREVWLPSLFGFQHTLRRLSADVARQRINTDVRQILTWLNDIERGLASGGELALVATRLVANSRRRWQADLQRAVENVQRAPEMLEIVREHLPEILRRDGAAIADRLVAKEFREARGDLKQSGFLGTLILTTTEPKDLGLLIANVRRLENATNLKIRFE